MDALEFGKEIGDMEGAEARATLRDVQSRYSKARQEHQETKETLSEYKDKLEVAEDEADEAREFFASFASDASGLSKDTILDKFDSADEIREEFLGDEAEFKLVSDEQETETEDEDESTFADKEEKSDNLPGDGGSSEFGDASQVISGMTVSHE